MEFKSRQKDFTNWLLVGYYVRNTPYSEFWHGSRFWPTSNAQHALISKRCSAFQSWNIRCIFSRHRQQHYLHS